MNIGNNIKKYRKLAGLTQSQLAQKCNKSLGTINKIENNKRNPSFDLVFKITEVLNIKMEQLKAEVHIENRTNQKPDLTNKIPIRGSITAGGLTEEDIIHAKIRKSLNMIENKDELEEIHSFIEFKMNKKK